VAVEQRIELISVKLHHPLQSIEYLCYNFSIAFRSGQMAVRYNNDSEILYEMESKQGATLLPLNTYIHTDKKGFKRLYVLSLPQRVFMFLEDAKCCILSSYFVTFMLFTITFNLFVFISSTLPAFNDTPANCFAPACNDEALCPGTMICEPMPQAWTQTVEFICVVIFTVDYFLRMCTVWAVPPRLSNTLLKVKKSTEHKMNSLFTSNEPSLKDELFAHVKLALSESELDSEMLIRTDRSKSVAQCASLNGLDGAARATRAISINGNSRLQFRRSDDSDIETSDDESGSNDNVSVSQLHSMDSHEDGTNFDDGYVLSDMNVPVRSTEYSSLTDQAASGAVSRRGSIYDNDFLAKRYSVKTKFHYQKQDNLADLDRKSRGMDKSHKYSGAYKTWVYAKKMLNIIDLLSILPFYVEKFVDASNSTSLSIVRILRLARVFRVFKVGKGNAGVQMLGKTVYVSMPALSLLAFFIVLGVILIGALIFFIEGGEFIVNNDYPSGAYLINDFFGKSVRTAYTSIISSIYWAVVVTTTTGYGDLVPMSFMGKFIAIVGAYYGVLLLALPITVIGNNFDKILNAQQGRDNEKFIYECLVGITRTLDLEYRARAQMAPPPSSAYKMTMVTAVISTFDSTKQFLLKDAITNANRAQAYKRRADAAQKQAIMRIKKESVSIARSAAERSGNQENATTTQSEMSDDISEESEEAYEWLGQSEDFQPDNHGADANGDPENVSRTDFQIWASKTGLNHVKHNSLKPLEQAKMVGITWNRMPKMPDKTYLNHYADKAGVPLGGQTPAKELEQARQDLNEAIAEWSALFATS